MTHVPYEPTISEEAELLGKVYGGRFLLTEVIGATSSAVVYKAHHRLLDKDFALKVVRKAQRKNERTIKRFLREAKIASAIDHSHIVAIYDFGLEENIPYLVMEYVDGPTLRQVLRASPAERLPLGQAVDLALQVTRALQHIHKRGVVHRNLKPENIVLTHRDGHADFVKILDLGVARATGQPSLTQNGEVLGTPEFIAPEGWNWGDAVEPTPGLDLYALGVLLHMMIVGKPPFVGDSGELMMEHLQTEAPRLIARVRSLEIPKELDDLCAALLKKDPNERPDSLHVLTVLEQTQSLLPPQSLRSLLLQKTLTLSPHERETYKFKKDEIQKAAATLILERPVTPQSAQVPPAPATVVLQAIPANAADPPLATLLVRVDALEAELERVRRKLRELTEVVGQRLWPQGWPPEAKALRAQIAADESREESMGIQLAVQEEQVQQLRQEGEGRKAILRKQVLALVGQLRDGTGDRTQIERQVAEAERAYASCLLDPRLGELDAVLSSQRLHLQDTRGDIHGGWLRLAKMVTQALSPQERDDRRKLEQLLGAIDSTQVALQKIVAQIKIKPAS